MVLLATTTMSVRVVSRRTVKPPPRPRERIPLTAWDLSMLDGDYQKRGLLYAAPPFPVARLVDHLSATLADALATYYPVAGRFATEQHRDGDDGKGGAVVVGCSVFIDCAGQGVEMIHAAADGGVAVADVAPPDADFPAALSSFFPLDGATNYDGHELPLLAVQVTELADGVFVGFAYSHALCDGTTWWDFLNAWAETARAGLSHPAAQRAAAAPVFERWSPDGGAAAPVVLPYADMTGLIKRLSPPPSPPPLRERMLHFSAESLMALKERAREELLAAGDEASAAAVTKFQALSSLLWRCVTRARRRQAPEQEQGTMTVCLFAVNNRGRLRPPLPAEYFGNSVCALATEAVGVPELLARGHGWAAAAAGRAAKAHTDAAIRARVAAWAAKPTVSLLRLFDPNGLVIASSPRFDVYGCDFGWGKPLAVRSGNCNKYDGKVSLFPGREGGGSIDVELALAPEHMAALEQDEEFWAVVSPDAAQVSGNNRKEDHACGSIQGFKLICNGTHYS